MRQGWLLPLVSLLLGADVYAPLTDEADPTRQDPRGKPAEDVLRQWQR